MGDTSHIVRARHDECLSSGNIVLSKSSDDSLSRRPKVHAVACSEVCNARLVQKALASFIKPAESCPIAASFPSIRSKDPNSSACWTLACIAFPEFGTSLRVMLKVVLMMD